MRPKRPNLEDFLDQAAMALVLASAAFVVIPIIKRLNNNDLDILCTALSLVSVIWAILRLKKRGYLK